jgi:hypothetical protein
MNIFYLFGGLLMLIFGAGAIGSGVILLFGLLTKNAVRKVCLSLGGLGMVGSVVALGLVAGCNHLLWAPSTDPIAVYRGAFNSAPPASVTNLQGKFSYGPDCGFRYVQFTTDEATFRSLLPKHLSKGGNDRPTRPSNPPEWWAPPVPGQTEVYHHSLKPDDANRPQGSSLFEATLMTWNPKTCLVQFYWEAID